MSLSSTAAARRSALAFIPASLVCLLALVRPAPLLAAGITHHAITARIDPAHAWLEASDDVSMRLAAGSDRRADIHLLLWRDLEVRQVTPSVAGATWQALPTADARFFTEEPDSVDRASLRPAQEIVLGAPAAGWPDSFGVRFEYAGVVYDSLREPETPYARGFPTSEGLIDTAGVYLAGSSLWVPSGLNDLAGYELTVDLPADWHSMSEGVLADSAVADGRRREIWRSPEPAQEVYLIAGRYVITREDWNGIEMLTYLYHPDPAISAKYLEATRRALEKYSRLIGPYPFRKFALVENFWQTGFGMPGFTLLGDRVIRLPFIVDTSYPHEILHNWWGNGVYVDHRRGNWCEGLTTYGADYLSKEDRSPAEARDYRRGVLIDYRNYVRERNDFPIEKFTGRSDPVTQNVGYGKGMMICHMLRRQLGDDRFWGGLRRFYHDWLFRPAGWRDLVHAWEEESGRDLGRFYDQWIARPGAPSILLEKARVAGTKGAWRTTFTLRQSSSPAFELSVPAVLRSGAAESTFVIPLDGASRGVTITTAWKPASLSIDPGFDCFREVDRREIPTTLSQTMGADSSLIVIASSLPPELEAAYRKAAQGFAGEERRMRVVDEKDVSADELARHAAWLLGDGALSRKLLAKASPAFAGHATVASSRWMLEGIAFEPKGRTLVLTTANPADAELAWTFILSADAASLPAVGRKLPHYGKYGYLVFEGDTNVAKGTLDPANSPLEARF